MDREELGKLLNLKVEFIPEGKQNRSGKKIVPQYITVHNTSNAGAGANADAHSRFVRNTGFYNIVSNGVTKKNWVSWHYTVDDICVIKHLPVNEHAIHAGAANSQSIGIETCMHKEINQHAADERVASLVAALLFDLNLGWLP
jgi:N-acetylmuramoyl-L-alanine amidase